MVKRATEDARKSKAAELGKQGAWKRWHLLESRLA
jgi:hypothetical protein